MPSAYQPYHPTPPPTRSPVLVHSAYGMPLAYPVALRSTDAVVPGAAMTWRSTPHVPSLSTCPSSASAAFSAPCTMTSAPSNSSSYRAEI
eukprot:2255374-Rhodomonas_salina.2